MANWGIKDIDSWKFDTLPLSPEWLDHLGDLNQGFRILIEGDPKNGKTQYLLQLLKDLALNVGKVSLNSVEQGKSKSLHEAFKRAKMNEIPAGKFMLADKSQKDFDKWMAKLKRNSGKTIALDSADYMNLTFAQWKQLHETFPQKNLIVVCWRINPIIKQLKHTMDAIIMVKDFKAVPLSRLGGNKTKIIWDKKDKGSQLRIALWSLTPTPLQKRGANPGCTSHGRIVTASGSNGNKARNNK